MKDKNMPSREALSSRQNEEDMVCDSTDIQQEETEAFVSRAISPAISHAAAKDREQPKTEINASKSCNQSGNESRSSKPNCYSCKWRGSVPGSAHSSCSHPITDFMDGAGKFLVLMYALKGLRSPIEKMLNLTYDQHGFDSGWFMWPINFDPVWLISCDGYEARGTSDE